MELQGFWKDIGKPPDYLLGTQLYLEYLRRVNPDALSTGDHVEGNVLIHPTATVSEEAKIGPNVTIAEGAVVEAGARVKDSIVLNGAKIEAGCFIDGSIVCRRIWPNPQDQQAGRP